MSGTSAFSKVSEVLTDDEDDRQAMWQLSRARFQKAQEVYTTKGSTLESLKLFEDAEHSLDPLLEASGLTGLREKELEAVLKGRLHRAVITAHLEELPDRWTQVKSHVEDVLQFDFNNPHARWLRGLSLLHGFQQRAEARNEMRRAVDCARQQKRGNEADQWEAEIEAAFSGEAEATPATAPTPAAASATPVAAPSKPKAAVGPADAAKPKTAARKSSSTLKGGFFHKASEKPANQKASVAEGGAAARAPLAKAESATSTAPLDVPSQRESGLKEELEALRERHRKRERELLKEAEGLKEQMSQDRSRREDWMGELSGALDALGAEVEDNLEPEEEERAANTEEVLRSLVGRVSELNDFSAADRTWAESAHQKYMDVTTEVSTLREMSSRETKEKQGDAQARTQEVKELTKRFGELKGATKSLRDGLRLLLGPSAGSTEATAEAEPVRIAEHARDFKALPATAKLSALLDDAAILRILIFLVLLGMLVALGLSVEIFGRRQCRFVCGR